MGEPVHDRPRAHWTTVGIFLILAVFLLDWAHQYLVPLTAAVLGFFLAWPLQQRLGRLGIPPTVTAALVTLVALAIVVTALGVLIAPFTALLSDLPDMIRDLQTDLAGAGGNAMSQLREAAEVAEDAVSGDRETFEVAVAENQSIFTRIATTAPAAATQIALGLIMLFFLVASGPGLVNAVVQAREGFTYKRRSVETISAVADKLGTYLGGITLINAGLGVCVGLALWWVGLPNPVVFGFLAFLLNYIPILGAVFGALIAAMVGYSDSGELWIAFLAWACYMGLSSLEGQFVTPYLISGRLSLNPAIVFLAVSFFAWIWSFIGMVMAVPILVATKIILDEFPETRPVARFLGAGRDASRKTVPEGEDDRDKKVA